MIDGIPRLLPPHLAATLGETYPDFFRRHTDLGVTARGDSGPTGRTLRTFGDEWRRFPHLEHVHSRIFRWYFEGAAPVRWAGLRVLDAGCGMGRWLHFARAEGADVVGMDLSPAIDVAARREGPEADLVQADLTSPPFPPGSFDLVYSLGVVHHLADPASGVRELSRLVRPGGELRLYVYRSLDGDPRWRRTVLRAVTLVRKATVRMSYPALHAFSWTVSAAATVLFLGPRRALRRTRVGDRLTRNLPLAQYADVPFRMLVAEQFDRFGAPIEARFSRDEVQELVSRTGLEIQALLPDLGWRAIARRLA